MNPMRVNKDNLEFKVVKRVKLTNVLTVAVKLIQNYVHIACNVVVGYYIGM